MNEIVVEGVDVGSGGKSLDKLELERDEKIGTIEDQIQNSAENVGNEPIKIEEEGGEEKKIEISKVVEGEGKEGGRRLPKINIKIPKILRRQPKESEKKSGEGESKPAEGVVGEGENVNLEGEKAHEGDDKICGENRDKKESDNLDTSSSSFFNSFSTPKWTNFRRVFSFNKSNPPTLTENEDKKGGEEPLPSAVILEIGEGGENKNDEKTEGPPEDVLVPVDEISKKKNKTALLSPILRLFTKKTSPKDVESGEVGTELLENKTESPNGDKKMDDAAKDETDAEKQTEENLKKGSTEELRKEKSVGSDSPLKSGAEMWKLSSSFLPGNRKLIGVGICSLLLLIITLISIGLLRSYKSIDIGTLILNGKYISTITSCGHVQGELESSGGYAFRGIPYALPPVGELRWRPAATHTQLSHCWNGTLPAKNQSMPPCWQFFRNGIYNGVEDCLYLDVYTPKPYYDEPFPVVVFIGGESLNGGVSTKNQPSSKLAKETNAVYVSVSIRRSIFGFLSLDVLSRNSYPITSGNYGLSDLVAALKWVKLNIKHFGGNPDEVTLLGHQSGGTLALALLSTNNTELFNQVWVSGGSTVHNLISVQEAEVQNSRFLSEVGCTSSSVLECLHNKGPEELMESVPREWRNFHQDLPSVGEKRHHWLINDGLILKEPMREELSIPQVQLPASSAHKIPFVGGAPAEVDGSLEMYNYLSWNDTKKFSAYLEGKLDTFSTSLSRQVTDRYFRPETTPWQTFASLLSDVRTICPLYYEALNRAKFFSSGKIPIYFYVVSQRRDSGTGLISDLNSDIEGIFGTYGGKNKEELKYGLNMRKLFTNFIHSGKLEEEGEDVTKFIYKIDESIQKIYTYPNCDFWKGQNFYPNYSRID